MDQEIVGSPNTVRPSNIKSPIVYKLGIVLLIFGTIISIFLFINSNTKLGKLKENLDETEMRYEALKESYSVLKKSQESSRMNPVTSLDQRSRDECIFDSKYLSFAFKYLSNKCESYTEYDLANATWPQMPNNLILYRKDGYEPGKEWWKSHIFDEAGLLSAEKYDYLITKSNNYTLMSVSINSKASIDSDSVESAGPYRGSRYYFIGDWVLRQKLITTGGAGSSDSLFNESLMLKGKK